MTVTTFRKYKTFLYDDKGKPIMVQLDLRNTMMKKIFEEIIEDFEDTLTAMDRDNDNTISHEEMKARILAIQTK